jgi:hypothetical protein
MEVFFNKKNLGFKVLAKSLGLHLGLRDKSITTTNGLWVQVVF